MVIELLELKVPSFPEILWLMKWDKHIWVEQSASRGRLGSKLGPDEKGLQCQAEELEL